MNCFSPQIIDAQLMVRFWKMEAPSQAQRVMLARSRKKLTKMITNLVKVT